MNPMQNKTPEERKAIAAKSHATRRQRKSEELALRNDALKYAGGLREQIAIMEARIASLQCIETLNAVSAEITKKILLRNEEISKYALPWEKSSGVYFLLDEDEVVYVGQSVNVYSRIAQHTDKKFNRYAFVPCAVSDLNILESLYIHCLRPKLNGIQRNDGKYAPFSLDALISMRPD